MSEYATRKIDGKEFKIGTCEDMFKCRYDQLGEITYPYMSDNLYWRIPTPDEDGILPGDYNYSLLQEDGVARKYSLPPWFSNGAIQNQQGEHYYLNGVQWAPRYTISERIEE